MEVIPSPQLESPLIPSEPPRMPLSSQANSPLRTTTLAPCKRIRRKASFICRLDSSEEAPSSHESIFHAECLSTTNSEDNDSGQCSEVATGSTPRPATTLAKLGNNENLREQLLSPIVGITPILYGHGTALTTIVEQKSTTTMNTRVSSAGPRSQSQLSFAITSTPKLLDHRSSFELPTTITLRPPRRRKSFSADDIILIKRSYHEACTMIERTTGISFQIHDIYAKPRTPVVPPIERPSTPPGMPSWTEAQNAPVQNITQARGLAARGSQNRLWRVLGIRPRPIKLPSSIPNQGALQGPRQREQVIQGRRPTSSPVPVRVAPRFRPIRSGHGVGPLEMHPFLRADRVDAKSEPATPPRQASNNQPTQTRAPDRTPNTTVRRTARRHTVHGGVSTPCPHRRGRLASLQNLRRPSELNILDPVPLRLNSSVRASNRIQTDSTQQAVPPDSGAVFQGSTAAPPVETHLSSPVMSGAMRSSDLINAPVRNKPEHHQCWKCRIASSLSKVDDVWDASTNWCCWVFCGVDLYEDENDHVQGARPDGMLRPRRVNVDGLRVMP